MMMFVRRIGMSCAVLCCVVFGSAAFAGDGDEIDGIVPTEVVVRLHPGEDVAEVVGDYAAVQGVVDDVASRNIYLLAVTPGQEEAVVAQMAGDPRLRWAEANYEGFDPEGRTGSFWVAGLHGAVDYQEQWAGGATGLGTAHALSTGEGIVVAVLDTGVDATHPELAGSVLPGYNFVDGNADTSDTPDGVDEDGDGTTDESVGHGTFVAGVVKFAAPDATILPVKVLTSDGSGDGFRWAKGVFWAVDQGADVLNMSLGSTYESLALEDAVVEALLIGAVPVGAAGNLNMELREYPAAMDLAVGVAATNENGAKASFSNYDDNLDIAAPGTGIVGTIPEDDDGNLYAEWSGTSMSTALTAGAIALLLEAHPNLPEGAGRFNLVQAALRAAADPIDDPLYWDEQLGAGLLDVPGAIQASVAALADYAVTYGTHVAGGSVELIEGGDENDYVRTRSRRGFTALEPNLTEIRFEYYATDVRPFLLRVESRINQPGGTAKVRFRNATTGSFEQVDQYSVGTTDGVYLKSNLPGATYIDANGRIELSLKHVVVATFSAQGFDSFFDEVRVVLQ